MRVSKCDLSENSFLWEKVAERDFIDCYCVEAHASPRSAAQIITTFPLWARILLRVRGLITAPFGLSNDGPDAADKVGPFPVEYENDEELIAGFDDKHLEFRVCVRAEKGQIYLATWVQPHNLGGKLYLMCIMPFHILIARDALRRVCQHSLGRISIESN